MRNFQVKKYGKLADFGSKRTKAFPRNCDSKSASAKIACPMCEQLLATPHSQS
jgi:hypothetical protein